MKKEALLLIDIQNIYFTPGPLLLHKPRETAKNARVILKKFRSEGKTVIHVKHNFKMFSDINKLVYPIDGEKIIYKEYPSSFLGTDLKEYLDEQKIEKIVVVGMMSHMCVDTTIRACQDYGYEVLVIADACTTKSLKYGNEVVPAKLVQAAYMASLDGMFAKVVNMKEYL